MKYLKSECESEIDKWQKRLANVKAEIIVNSWYKCNEIDTLWYIKDVLKNGLGAGYGLCRGFYNGDCKTIRISKPWFDWELATTSEVKEALVKEAKRRGFDFNNYFYIGGVLKGASYSLESLSLKFLFDNGDWVINTPTYTHKELVNLIGHEFNTK